MENTRQLGQELLGEIGEVDDSPSNWLKLAVLRVAESARQVLPEGDQTAISIQSVFRAEVSGVLRSRDPLRTDSNDIVVEAVRGSGLSLMAGDVSPIVLRLRQDDFRNPGSASTPFGLESAESPLVPPRVQAQLCRVADDLEKETGSAVEVEWGADGQRVVLFQFRAAQDGSDVQELINREVDRLRTLAAKGRRIWVRHQLAESLPLPRPLTWSVWNRFMSTEGGLGRLYRELGYAPKRFEDGGGCLQLIAGRIYADPDRLSRMVCPSYAGRLDTDRIVARPYRLPNPPGQIDPKRLDPWLLFKWPHLLWVLWRAQRKRARLEQQAARTFNESTIPSFEAEYDRLSNDHPGEAASVAELVTHVEQVRGWLFDKQAPRLMLPGWLGVQAWQEVDDFLRPLLPHHQAVALSHRVLRILEAGDAGSGVTGDDCTLEAGDARWDAAPLELGEVLPVAAQPVTSKHASAENSQREASESAAAAIRDQMRCALPRRLTQRLLTAAELLPLRVMGKRRLLCGYQLLRELTARLAESSGLGERLYELSWEELLLLDREAPQSKTLQARRRERELWRRCDVPDVILGDAEQPLSPTPTEAKSGPWKVTVVSAGMVSGPIWRAASDEEVCPPGSIIVAETADSSDVLRRQSAAGLVVERGGLLSHAAVTARQLSIPMVILKDARRLLQDESRLHIDTGAGIVMTPTVDEDRTR